MDMEEIRKLGYVATEEACSIVGIAHGGNVPAFMEKHGVRTMEFGSPGSKMKRRFYNRDDLGKIPPRDPSEPPPMNGGVLAGRIRALEMRIESLEKFKREFE